MDHQLRLTKEKAELKKGPIPEVCPVDLEISCITLTPQCPCFTVHKCIEIGGACAASIGTDCQPIGPSGARVGCGCGGKKGPHHLESCALYSLVDDGKPTGLLKCGCGGKKKPKHLESCPLKLLQQQAPKQCCEDAELCVFTGDSIEGTYQITVTKQGQESTIFASNLLVTNISQGPITFTQLTATVTQANNPTECTTSVTLGNVTQKLNPPVVVAPGQTVTIPFAGAFTLAQPCGGLGSCPIVLTVTISNSSQSATTTNSFSCLDVPQCEISERCLVDNGIPGFPPTPVPVGEEGPIVVEASFGPIQIVGDACGQPITNQAQLLPFPCGCCVQPSSYWIDANCAAFTTIEDCQAGIDIFPNTWPSVEGGIILPTGEAAYDQCGLLQYLCGACPGGSDCTDDAFVQLFKEYVAAILNINQCIPGVGGDPVLYTPDVQNQLGAAFYNTLTSAQDYIGEKIVVPGDLCTIDLTNFTCDQIPSSGGVSFTTTLAAFNGGANPAFPSCSSVRPPCPPCNEQGEVDSNTTTITPTCATCTVDATITAQCQENQRLCLCKTATPFTSQTCQGSFPSDQFIAYQVVVTPQDEASSSCTITASATVTVSCALPYDKQFQVAFDFSSIGLGTSVVTVTLPAGQTSVSVPPFTINVAGPLPPSFTVAVGVFPSNATFNLTTCTVAENGFATTASCSQLVTVTPTTGPFSVLLCDTVTAQPGGQQLQPIDAFAQGYPPGSPCLQPPLAGITATINGAIVPTAQFADTIGAIFDGCLDLAAAGLIVDLDPIVIGYVVNVPPCTTCVTNAASLTVTSGSQSQCNSGVTGKDTSSVTVGFSPPVPPCLTEPKIFQTKPTKKEEKEEKKVVAPAATVSATAPVTAPIAKPKNAGGNNKIRARAIFGAKKL